MFAVKIWAATREQRGIEVADLLIALASITG